MNMTSQSSTRGRLRVAAPGQAPTAGYACQDHLRSRVTAREQLSRQGQSGNNEAAKQGTGNPFTLAKTKNEPRARVHQVASTQTRQGRVKPW